MSKDMPMYRHGDETQPAPLMISLDCNELIKPLQWIPIVPTEWEEDMMREQERFRRELLEMSRMPPDMIGEIRQNDDRNGSETTP